MGTPCTVGTSTSLAGCEAGPCRLSGEPGVTSDALILLRGEDGKRMEPGASVFTCLGSVSDKSSKLALQFAGGDTRG